MMLKSFREFKKQIGFSLDEIVRIDYTPGFMDALRDHVKEAGWDVISEIQLFNANKQKWKTSNLDGWISQAARCLQNTNHERKI